MILRLATLHEKALVGRGLPRPRPSGAAATRPYDLFRGNFHGRRFPPPRQAKVLKLWNNPRTGTPWPAALPPGVIRQAGRRFWATGWGAPARNLDGLSKPKTRDVEFLTASLRRWGPGACSLAQAYARIVADALGSVKHQLRGHQFLGARCLRLAWQGAPGSAAAELAKLPP
jgi:hypothetical protein